MTEAEALRALHSEDERVIARAEAALWEMWCRSGRSDVDAAFRTGIAQMERREFREAAGAFSRVIELMPEFTEGWNKRATVRYLLQDYEGAVADCRETLARKPAHFGALSGQGLCHLALGQPVAAAACFRRVIEVHPRLASARENLATAVGRLAQGNGHT